MQVENDITVYKSNQLKSKIIFKLKTQHHFQARYILISFVHCWIIDVELLIWTNWFPIWSVEYRTPTTKLLIKFGMRTL